jgi:predicted Fe-Mo cluster-binding NifX family protein
MTLGKPASKVIGVCLPSGGQGFTPRFLYIALADLTLRVRELVKAHYVANQIENRIKSVMEEKLLPNPHQSVKTGKGIMVSEWLVGQGVDEVIVAKSYEHKGPYYVFADAGVTIQQTEKRDIGQIESGLVALEGEAETRQEA